MYIYLNPPRAFWQIPETDVSLSRQKPLVSLSEEDLGALSPEAQEILEKSIKIGTVSVVTDSRLLKGADERGDIDILGLPATEVHRRYISRIVLRGRDGLSEMEALLERELSSERPRQDLIAVMKNGIEQIKIRHPLSEQDQFFSEIEVIEDDAPVAVAAPEKKKGRLRTSAQKTEKT
jgi:hypothetical protein